MPKCINQHESNSLICPVCRKPVLFKEACTNLARIPQFSPALEDRLSLSVGFPAPELPNTYGLNVLAGANQKTTEKEFTATAAEYATWATYYSDHLQGLRRWLVMMGFSLVRERLIFVDTTSPLSVLSLMALPKAGNTIVFGIVADETSTLIDQNTSYSALKVIERLRLPTILVTKSYTANAVGFFEKEGLLTKEAALSATLSFLVEAPTSIMGIMKKDEQLGVFTHCISATISGSRTVFRSPDDALKIQMGSKSVNTSDDDIQTIYLLARAQGDAQREISAAFESRSRRLGGILNAEQSVAAAETEYDLYTILTLYGIRGDEVIKPLEKGYDRIARRSGNLRVELLT
jgi:hypothetical protein